jgi:HEPN domain-containing protein
LEKKKHILWYSEAENDFEMAEILLKSEHYNGAVFHCQQAGEKALKALLYFLNEQPWGHSLYNLLESAEKILGSIDPALKNASRDLDRHYTTTRYPDGLPDITPKNAYDEEIADLMITKASLILEFVNHHFTAKSSQITKEKLPSTQNGDES